jgi:hypothetical protein
MGGKMISKRDFEGLFIGFWVGMFIATVLFCLAWPSKSQCVDCGGWEYSEFITTHKCNWRFQ